VNQLQRDLIDINQDCVKEVLKITPENIFALGQAFGQTNYGINNKKTVFKPNAVYSDQILQLRLKILSKLEEIEGNTSSQWRLQEWFSFAFRFWEFTKTFNGIIDYSSLAQKREDGLLLAHIEEITEKQLEHPLEISILPNI